MKQAVITWLESGADAQEGVQLMSRAGAPSRALKFIRAWPTRYSSLIRNWLCWKYGIQYHPTNQVNDEPSRVKSFREEFPFLNEIGCPIELETLASRKFARYHAYKNCHARLRTCSDLKECADTARELLDNYMDNRLIWEELNYYLQHKTVLGKHPIFAEFNRRKELNSMPVRQLLKRKKQIEDNIWRVQSELRKGNKPHLAPERRSRLNSYQAELAEVNRLLGDDE